MTLCLHCPHFDTEHGSEPNGKCQTPVQIPTDSGVIVSRCGCPGYAPDNWINPDAKKLARPYPNVSVSPTSKDRWEARHPRNGRSKYLGTFDTPEQARRAVLLAQAEHLEAKALSYRQEALAMISFAEGK